MTQFALSSPTSSPIQLDLFFITPLWFFALYSKFLRQPIPENSWLFHTFYCECPYKMNSEIFVLPPSRALLGHPVQKKFILFSFHKQKSSYNPYLKFLDFSQLLVADTPIKNFSKNFVYTLWQHFWDTRYKYIFFVFCFNQKNLFTKPSWNNF